MAKSPIPVDASHPVLKRSADDLRPRWRSVEEAAGKFIPRLLAFAAAYRDAYVEVRRTLGLEAVRRLNASIGLTDTAASRMRDIAGARKSLTPHVKTLPVSVDAI